MGDEPHEKSYVVASYMQRGMVRLRLRGYRYTMSNDLIQQQQNLNCSASHRGMILLLILMCLVFCAGCVI